MVIYVIIMTEVIIMRVTTSKSKNSESFYITQSYTSAQGKSTSKTIRKLGTLADLSKQLHTDREGVLAWANEQARLETLKYKSEKEDATVMIPFHSNRFMDYHKQKLFSGGYLFLQSIYYGLKMDSICRKIKSRHKFEYDLNAILSDLIYTRVLEPSSKSSSFRAAKQFLEPPTYELHDVYRALSVLASEMDFIQSEVYKNSFFLGNRNDRILYYDCTNYYFEIEQEDGDKKYGKSKEHRPNPIIQMGLFTDGDGIPLAFSLFPGNQNEQKSLKPLETKILQQFGCEKFIYCSDAGLASEDNRVLNHMGQRAFIVTQSIKKLPAEDRAWALNKTDFKRLSDDKVVDITNLTENDKEMLDNPKQKHAFHGLYRSLVHNMVVGVSEGYKKELELVGVGYRASNQGNIIELALGYTHNIFIQLPAEVKVETKSERNKNPLIILESCDKQLLGQVCSKIRSFRKPEPYKGKGIKFVGEEIRRKSGKSAGK